MRNLKSKFWVAVVVGVGLLAVSCAPGSLDSGADVVVTVQTMTIPPIAGAAGGGGGCVFTVTDATASLQSQPKNGAAGSPFNDTILSSVTIGYSWDTAGLVTPTRTFNISGTIPADGTASVQFPSIAAGDLSAPFASHTATLSITFTGATVSGDGVSVPAGGNLTVNACL